MDKPNQPEAPDEGVRERQKMGQNKKEDWCIIVELPKQPMVRVQLVNLDEPAFNSASRT